MNDLDQQLITALRHDGRASISDLAVQLGVSRATVRTRMDRLRTDGTITGFTVILRSDAFQQPVRGLMMVAIAGAHTRRIIGQLQGFAQVTAIHTTNGRWDLVLELGTTSLEDFDEVLHRVRRIDGVTQSETSLLLSTPRSTRAGLSQD